MSVHDRVRALILGAGAAVALATLGIADMDRPDADLSQWLFLFGLAVFAFLPYAVLALAARTGPAWVPLFAALVMLGLDLGARIRLRWFPQDAQDGLLLMFLPLWLLPASLLLWIALVALRGWRARQR
ncbi:hypothetical protein E4582_06495 [Luteimonas yindakuii]|uniref:Uncharacterized protein n=1 Tax=Luteimonas yindakuii TaxID=2565782 RepID=A0A4Z1R4M9_9GAMM|nr:hypothetical protein [Luteimonas yindakuii]TKS54450.1 hypothetical protein E4582_06495 [Luteimonas yindakuii]